MTSTQIRQSFLDFFQSKQHTIVPSSSLLPDSPNLLFTNAGMNQFVPIFLGQVKCPYMPGRAADTQKCIRAGGKHNDLEDVGLDTYHHTFFEMLGNWSFGDYFKKEAIEWAWELVVGTWKFPPERLYATVYCPHMDMDQWRNELSKAVEFAKARQAGITAVIGDEVGGGAQGELAINFSDREAASQWAEHFLKAGLDPFVHIVPGNRKDNFWMMGDTGPCGPCSELHVDLTPNGDTQGALVNQGSAQCIEIWNLVFMQFNANPDGISPLPAKSVDTGMGFERVTGIIQNTRGFTDFSRVISNYETDIFRPIFDALEKLSGKKYGSTLPPTTRSAVPDKDEGARASSPAAAGVPPTASSEPPASYRKRRLPHFERPWAKYMVTFSTYERKPLSPAARDIVLQSLLFGHEQRRYQLFAACVMPDHVHVLFEPQIKQEDQQGKPVFWSVKEVLQGIKSFTAHEINKAAGRTGQVWENESLDRMIRGDSDLEEKFHYICRNPWESGPVPVTENYPWLWTPDLPGAGPIPAKGSATVPVASAGVTPDESARESRANLSVRPASHVPETAARDTQQGDRDGRAPLSPEQIATDIAFRVIADHIRTLSFAIADGIQPGNTDRNYVLRRILRRAVRYGRTLGFHEPFFYKLVDVLADTMGDVFPEIRAKQKHVQEVIRTEEEAFNKTLDTGIDRFEGLLVTAIGQQLVFATMGHERRFDVVYRSLTYANLSTDPNTPCIRIDLESNFLPILKQLGLDNPVFPGNFAFELYDTYGFPLDLTELMARERGLTVDVEGFNRLMDEQKARARAAQKKTVIELSQVETQTPTEFVGFDKLETPAKVLEVVSLKDKTAVILDTSASYAEMGGQVGDTGKLEHGAQLWRVTNTQKYGDTWLHFLETENLKLETPPVPGSAVRLSVDAPRRAAIQRHHTVTHLLHWALHEVVSKDASQKGSFVGPDKLTFDFNSAPLTPQQVADVERLVNERILENAPVSWTEVKYNHVKIRDDIMQFFGEKYGDWVRVVQIGGRPTGLDGYSMELCGGTHTRATGEIGLFRIVSETAIAAGVRRIEAVAGLEAWRRAGEELALLKNVAGRLATPIPDLDKKIENVLAQQKELEKQLRAIQQKAAAAEARSLLGKAASINGIPALIERFDADGDTLQGIVNDLKGQFKGVILLGGAAAGAVALVAAVSPEFTARIQAGKLIQQIAPIVGGKGGGRPDNARGGGKLVDKLGEALAKARSLLG
jgi:alanyl-tRNA synthetase/REP element-mobilizing transposase RayT